MPQFDKITFFNQIFWLIFFFSSTYFLFLYKVLPKIASSLKIRIKVLRKGNTALESSVKQQNNEIIFFNSLIDNPIIFSKVFFKNFLILNNQFFFSKFLEIKKNFLFFSKVYLEKKFKEEGLVSYFFLLEEYYLLVISYCIKARKGFKVLKKSKKKKKSIFFSVFFLSFLFRIKIIFFFLNLIKKKKISRKFLITSSTLKNKKRRTLIKVKV